MFYIKKIIAICLSIAMVMCSTLPSLASENDALQETTESKIVEQLKEDLGEEKANEILNAYEETRNEDVGDDRMLSHDEKPEETETSMGELHEPEETETNASTENVGASTASPEEVTDEDVSSKSEENETSMSELSTTEEEETNNSEIYESEINEANVNETIDDNLVETSETNVDEIIATSSDLENDLILLEVEESEGNNSNLFGDGESNTYIFTKDWATSCGINKKDITKIVFQKGGTIPSGTEFSIGTTGLKGYTNGTEVTIFTPNTNDVINAAADSSRMFSAFETGPYNSAPEMNLTSIVGLSNLKTNNVRSMEGMFLGCANISNIDLSSFDTSNVQDFGYMFYNCNGATSIDVSSFNTSNAINFGAMFQNCSSLNSIDISNFDYSSVDSTNHTDYSTFNLTFAENTSTALMMGHMFDGCSSITTINMGNVNANNCRNFASLFKGCENLHTITYSNFDVSSAISLNSMFSNCSSLSSIDLTSFNTTNIEYASFLFMGCSELTSLNININTESLISMLSMFYGCSKLTLIDLSSFNTSLVTNTTNCFKNCDSLATIKVSNNFVTSSITSDSDMFYGCTSLVGGYGTTYDSSHTGKEYARIDGGPTSATPGYFTLAGGGAPILSSITVNTPPTKVKYKAGELFDPTGIKINLNYSDSSTDTVTYNSTTSANFTFNPSLTTALKASNTYVTITYGGKTCNQDVEVIAPQNIAVKTAPSKVKYAIGETFNPTGLKINLIYSDTTTIEEVAYAGNETNFSFNPSGALNTAGASIPITITYTKNGSSFNCVQNVEVVELSSIAITTHATKLNYNTGETFDPTGLVITLTYSDSSTERVIYNATTSSSFTFSPTGPLTRTGNVITVTYAGKTTTETLNVKELTGITIATNPTKLSYATGQSLNPAGLVLTLTYTDSNNANTTENVTYNSTTQSKFTFNPSGTAITTGNVTVTYDGKTGASMQPTFAITVRTVASISVINRPSKTSYSNGEKLALSGLSIKVNYADGTNEIVAYSSSNSGDFSFNPSTSHQATQVLRIWRWH